MEKEIWVGRDDIVKVRVAEINAKKDECGDYEVKASIDCFIDRDKIETFMKDLEKLIKENSI